MAEYTVSDPDALITCPYERAHRVRAKRFIYHLRKCRSNYSGNDYVQCPFNATHEMPKPELPYHLTTCPDKPLVEREIYAAQQRVPKSVSKPGTFVFQSMPVPDSSEDWVEESHPPMVGFDPQMLANTKNLRFVKNNIDLSGCSPLEKRNFEKQLLEEHYAKLKDDEERSLAEEKKKASAKPTRPVDIRKPMARSQAAGVGRGGGGVIFKQPQAPQPGRLAAHFEGTTPLPSAKSSVVGSEIGRPCSEAGSSTAYSEKDDLMSNLIVGRGVGRGLVQRKRDM